MSQYLNTDETETRDLSSRYRVSYALVVGTLVIFAIRLWYLQVMSGDELRAFSEQNSIKETKIMAPRGIIYDQNGQILVETVPGFEVSVRPHFVNDLEKTAAALSSILNIPATQIVSSIKKSRKQNGPFRPVRIKENLSRDEIFPLELLNIDYSGIEINETVLRKYPLVQNGAQLFGYVAEISKTQLPRLNEKYKNRFRFEQGDLIGKAGIEEALDLSLRGRDGVSISQVDARGRPPAPDAPTLFGSLSSIQRAEFGKNVTLTIDRDIQEAAFNAFFEGGRTGGAIAMRTNGEILAWVSSPSFDPNAFSTGMSSATWQSLIGDPDKPLRNKPIQDHNMPGSTLKPLIALAALQEKIITPNQIVYAPGVMKFGNRPYHDTLKQGHGNINVVDAIERSANIFFYKMGIQLGVDRMFKYCNALGIGQKTGIDLADERPGLMPNTRWKKDALGEEWQPGENLSVAIGQGFVLTTPIQMMVAYNAIGTEGLVYKPYVVKKIMTADNRIEKEFHPTLVRDLSDANSDVFVRKEVFKAVKEGLRRVVNGERGTARGSKLSFVEMAGKTGTSQVMSFSADQIYTKCESQPRHKRHHGWFIGYAPADNPEISFAVFAEHSCHGSSGAAPVAREIVRSYVTKYHPEWLSRDQQKRKLEARPQKADDAGHEKIDGE